MIIKGMSHPDGKTKADGRLARWNSRTGMSGGAAKDHSERKLPARRGTQKSFQEKKVKRKSGAEGPPKNPWKGWKSDPQKAREGQG